MAPSPARRAARLHRLAPAAALAALLCACKPAVRMGTIPGSSAQALTYSGPECDEVRDVPETARGWSVPPRKVDYDARLHVLLSVCDFSRVDRRDDLGRTVSTAVFRKITPFDAFAAHEQHDAGALDPVKAALIVLALVDGDEGVRARTAARPAAQAAADATVPPEANGLVGLAALYLTLIDRAALAEALRGANVTPIVADTFLEKLDLAGELLAARSAAMPRTQRRVFVEIPREVYEERRLYLHVNRELYARLAAVAERARSSPSRALVDELFALRAEYLTGCPDEECTYDPFYMAVTTETARVCVKLGDVLCAHAESSLLRREDAEKKRLAHAIESAQLTAAAAPRDAYENERRAARIGTSDEDTAVLLRGVEPVRFTPEHFYRARFRYPDPAEGLDETSALPKEERAVIASARKQGASFVVEFRTEHEERQEPYNCVRTGRLKGIAHDGSLLWDVNCQYRTRKIPLPKPDPVVVRAAEGASLQAGDLVTVLVDVEARDRAATVISARRGARLVQLRADRLGAAPRR